MTPTATNQRRAAAVLAAALGLIIAGLLIYTGTGTTYPPPDCAQTRTCQTPEEIYLAGLRTEYVDGDLRPGGDYTTVSDAELLAMGRALCGRMPTGGADVSLELTEQAMWATNNDMDPALVGAAGRLCD